MRRLSRNAEYTAHSHKTPLHREERSVQEQNGWKGTNLDIPILVLSFVFDHLFDAKDRRKN